MFGRATIRLGIGPHSSALCLLAAKCMQINLEHNSAHFREKAVQKFSQISSVLEFGHLEFPTHEKVLIVWMYLKHSNSLLTQLVIR